MPLRLGLRELLRQVLIGFLSIFNRPVTLRKRHRDIYAQIDVHLLRHPDLPPLPV